MGQTHSFREIILGSSSGAHVNISYPKGLCTGDVGRKTKPEVFYVILAATDVHPDFIVTKSVPSFMLFAIIDGHIVY